MLFGWMDGWMDRWREGGIEGWNYIWDLKNHSRLLFVTQVDIFATFSPKQPFQLILFSRERNLSHSYKNEKIAKSTKCSNTSILKNEAKLLKVTNVQGRNIVYMVSWIWQYNLPHVKYSNIIATLITYYMPGTLLCT